MSEPRYKKRVLFDKARPCFHCSMSLQYLTSGRDKSNYVGFTLEISEGEEGVFHLSCIDLFLLDFSPETDFDDYKTYPERIKDIFDVKSRVF